MRCSTTPLAVPARWAGTLSMTIAMIGGTVKDPPTPTGTMTSATSSAGESEGRRQSPVSPTAMMICPAAIMATCP